RGYGRQGLSRKFAGCRRRDLSCGTDDGCPPTAIALIPRGAHAGPYSWTRRSLAVTQTTETIPLLDDVPPEELRRIVLAVYRAHQLVAAITDVDTLLRRIMEESKQVAQATACSLMLFDEAR